MAQSTAPALCPQCGSQHTYKLLSQISFVSGSKRPANVSMQGGACGCGGSCACGGH